MGCPFLVRYKVFASHVASSRSVGRYVPIVSVRLDGLLKKRLIC